jgi:hypothetical protein
MLHLQQAGHINKLANIAKLANNQGGVAPPNLKLSQDLSQACPNMAGKHPKTPIYGGGFAYPGFLQSFYLQRPKLDVKNAKMEIFIRGGGGRGVLRKIITLLGQGFQ